VVNPASILRWNSDKAYLAELSMAGIATVPTRMVNHLRSEDLAAAQADFGTDILVVKPPISGGADGTYKLTSQDKIPEQVSGKRMMIQPFLSNITDEGEYSLFYFGGQLSHAILKRPATGDFRVQEQFGGTETSIVPAEQAKLVSEAAMAAACGINHCPDLAYARVDLLRGNDGKFLLMELELIEPSLFLRFADDNGSAFAEKMLQVASANLG
jgi:glutathione synthase/RimK-type ligase-like ATP-grasp enzyme